MTDNLNKSKVLVLNRNWQAIHIRTPHEAFCMMATNAAGGFWGSCYFWVGKE